MYDFSREKVHKIVQRPEAGVNTATYTQLSLKNIYFSHMARGSLINIFFPSKKILQII